MNIILGFGSTEKDFERKLELMIRERVRTEFKNETESSGFFVDSFVEKIRSWIENLSEESKKGAKTYKSAINPPQRYSSFYSAVLSDANYIVFILDFMHVNRKHPASTDGWALMTNEITFNVTHEEAESDE